MKTNFEKRTCLLKSSLKQEKTGTMETKVELYAVLLSSEQIIKNKFILERIIGSAFVLLWSPSNLIELRGNEHPLSISILFHVNIKT